MAALTLAQVTVLRDAWYAAVQALATGQSYSIGGRSLTRANLSQASAELDKWERQVERLTAGRTGLRVQRVVPRD